MIEILLIVTINLILFVLLIDLMSLRLNWAALTANRLPALPKATKQELINTSIRKELL